LPAVDRTAFPWTFDQQNAAATISTLTHSARYNSSTGSLISSPLSDSCGGRGLGCQIVIAIFGFKRWASLVAHRHSIAVWAHIWLSPPPCAGFCLLVFMKPPGSVAAPKLCVELVCVRLCVCVCVCVCVCGASTLSVYVSFTRVVCLRSHSVSEAGDKLPPLDDIHMTRHSLVRTFLGAFRERKDWCYV
jgi:hypothetical protein